MVGAIDVKAVTFTCISMSVFSKWCTNCRKNLGCMQETSGIQVGVGKRARVLKCRYMYFILGKCMYV